jgi:carboxylesterase type B
MKTAIVSAIAAGLWQIVAAVPALSATSTVRVPVPSGIIIGLVGDTVETFNGIPYADPPIVDLRFKPPVKLSKPLGTFDATGDAAACSRGPLVTIPFCASPSNVTNAPSAASLLRSTAGENSTTTTEDCLTISVQRPHGYEAGAGLPVLFWIFGGGFVAGSTSGHNATRLIETGVLHKQPFIFVAVNYRLGAWGFMPGKEIFNEGSGNAGLLDQRMGLEWVADNIEFFGGDPDKVTIWGQSSGAISVFEQLVLYNGDANYNGKPLFRAAILDSGSITPVDPLYTPKGQKVYDAVVKAAKCDTHNDTLDCLRSLDNEEFTVAANSVPALISYESLALSYLPRPDGKVLKDSPDVLAKAGKFHHVPLIFGSQEDEGSIFNLCQRDMGTTAKIAKYLSDYYFWTATDEQGLVTNFVNTYSPFVWDGCPYRTGLRFQGYPGSKRIASILGDIVFDLMRRVTLQILSNVSPQLPTWAYFSSYNHQPLNPIAGGLGTFHGSDTIVLFDQDDKYPTLSGRTYYINFLYNLDPNVGTEPDLHWPKWKEGKQLLNFGAKNNSLLEDTYRNSSYAYMINHIDSLHF